jgi:hypothetical protein
MSILVLTSDTLIGTPATGNLEYNGQFFGTDSNASRAQLQRIAQGTAVASTSGTSISFTALPAWVERITINFSGVSTNGTSAYLVQLGTGSTTYTTSGYAGSGSLVAAAGVSTVRSTAGLFLRVNSASSVTHGQVVITLLTGNTYSMTGTLGDSVNDQLYIAGSSVALAAALTAVRITTVNGTDTFDAGSINIMYEG